MHRQQPFHPHHSCPKRSRIKDRISTHRVKAPQKSRVHKSSARSFSTSSTMVGPLSDQSHFPSASLAVVDISCMFDKNEPSICHFTDVSQLNPEQQTAIKALCDAERSTGFFYVTGSPLQQKTKALQQSTMDFFAQPMTIKQLSAAHATRRGYHRFQGRPEHSGDNQSDKIEAFTIQSSRYTDRQLQDAMLTSSENDTNDTIEPVNDVPSGVYLPPHILAMIQEQEQQKPESVKPSQAHNCTIDDSNNWPKTPNEALNSAFQSNYKSYWDAACGTAQVIVAMLCLGFGIPPQHVLQDHKMDNHTLESKLYPLLNKSSQKPQDTSNDSDARSSTNHLHNSLNPNNVLDQFQLRFPVHVDLSTVTLLTQTHDQGGLLIAARHQYDNSKASRDVMSQSSQDTVPFEWKRVTTPDNFTPQDVTLVNIGDFLTHYSGGTLHSAPHCVIDVESSTPKMQTDPRMSTVFFYMPDMDAEITDLIHPNNPAFAPYIAGEKMPLL